MKQNDSALAVLERHLIAERHRNELLLARLSEKSPVNWTTIVRSRKRLLLLSVACLLFALMITAVSAIIASFVIVWHMQVH